MRLRDPAKREGKREGEGEVVKGWSLLKRRVVVARVLQVGKQLRVLRLADEGQGTRGGWARIHGRPRAQRWRRARAAVHVLVPVLDSAQESHVFSCRDVGAERSGGALGLLEALLEQQDRAERRRLEVALHGGAHHA